MEILEKKILDLINEYLKSASYLINIIKDTYPISNDGILRSRKLNIIPKEGIINGIIFNFHGGGCFFELQDDSIDIDFGPNDRVDGFDYNRIKDFCSFRFIRYPEFRDETVLQKCFNALIVKKIIINPKLYPNPHLYYLNEGR